MKNIIVKTACMFVFSLALVGCGGSSDGSDILSDGTSAGSETGAAETIEAETGETETNETEADGSEINETETGETDISETEVDETETSEAGESPSEGTDTGGIDIGLGNVSLVYSPNEPVPGIPGATFTSLLTSTISPQGTVAFSATFRDTAGNRGSGLFVGLPGQWQLVAQSSDAIDGLPSNVLFSEAVLLEIAVDGTMGVLFQTTGASEGTAFAVWDGSILSTKFRTGDLAPGFSDARVVGQILNMDYSSAGALLTANSQLFTHGLWHWDGESVELVAPQFGAAPVVDSLRRDQTDCEVYLALDFALLGGPRINEVGDIAFNAILNRPNSQSACNNGSGIVRYESGAMSTVLRSNSQVPNTETATLIGPALYNLMESGALAFSSVLDDENASGLDTGRLAHWVLDASDNLSLVTIVQELLPPGFDRRIDLIAHAPYVYSSSETFSVQLARTGTEVVLLGGPGHSGQPYSDIGATGAASMNLIAESPGNAPAGFEESAFIDSFSNPAIDRNGRIYYRATVIDAVTEESVEVLYYATADSIPVPIAQAGDGVQLSDERLEIDNFSFIDAPLFTLINFTPIAMLTDDQGGLLAGARLENNQFALLLVRTP